MKSKIFILDTNVMLHDHKCLSRFENNDIIIPISVLEELDNFKKGSDIINYQARSFVRNLESLVGDELFGDGVGLGEGQGVLSVYAPAPEHEVAAVLAFEVIGLHVCGRALHGVENIKARFDKVRDQLFYRAA